MDYRMVVVGACVCGAVCAAMSASKMTAAALSIALARLASVPTDLIKT